MGGELRKFNARREAKKKFDEVYAKRDQYIVLHYSCESFYDIKEGRTPRITSIAARNYVTGQTLSFSIHKEAELKGVPFAEITDNYDTLEKDTLKEFFEFLKSRHGFKFIHWNMRDINYGFQGIEHRYRVLGGDPLVIEDDRKFDLARELIALYGVGYAPHNEAGRLHAIMELNHVTAKDAMTGAQEAKAFEEKEYVKLHQSTLRKVDVISNILERTFVGTLITKAKWHERYGIHPMAIIEWLREQWLWVLAGLVAAGIGLVASIKDLIPS